MGMPIGEPFHVYVMIFDEDALNAVSYGLEVPGLGTDIFRAEDTLYGPSGNGINIVTSNGNNVGLGECAQGFQHAPILVADYSFVYFSYLSSRTISAVPNADSDPGVPVVSDCAVQLHSCALGPTLYLDMCGGFPAESHSFGEVKALYSTR